eukprot:scaffold20878_cov21-Prasinocladus_malaysianus.AAC.1
MPVVENESSVAEIEKGRFKLGRSLWLTGGCIGASGEPEAGSGRRRLRQQQPAVLHGPRGHAKVRRVGDPEGAGPPNKQSQTNYSG